MEYRFNTNEEKNLVQLVEKGVLPLLRKKINLMSDAELKAELVEVKVALERVNAEKLLGLKRVHHGGAELGDG
jgi:hypothetical protein